MLSIQILTVNLRLTYVAAFQRKLLVLMVALNRLSISSISLLTALSASDIGGEFLSFVSFRCCSWSRLAVCHRLLSLYWLELAEDICGETNPVLSARYEEDPLKLPWRKSDSLVEGSKWGGICCRTLAIMSYIQLLIWFPGWLNENVRCSMVSYCEYYIFV